MTQPSVSDLRPGRSIASVVALLHVCYSNLMFALSRAIFCLGLLVLPFVSVAQGAIDSTKYVMCRSQKTVRTIRVVDGPEACTTLYTKSGVDKVVGGGKNRQSCYDVMKNIRTNLEGAAWKCKDISTAKVSELSN